MRSPAHRTTDNASTSALVREAVRRLRDAYSPDRIILFGSHARGDARADSDYDFLVIVPREARGERLRSRSGYRLLAGMRAPIDVVVWPSDKYSQQMSVPSSLPATVAREGVVVYDA